MKRDQQPELMDDPNLPRDEHQRTLAGLARLNRWSGVARATYTHIRHYAVESGARPLRVLDVASGGGDVPIAWARRADREGLPIEITTTDVRSVAIETQQRLARTAGVNITTMEIDCLKSPLPNGFDLVTCSLFMHHLDEHQTFCLLQSMQAASENPILVCDLERSYLNLALVKIASKTLSRSDVVHTDAMLSVRAAYTLDEFKSIAQRALARPVLVKRAFPCRFIAMLDEQMVAEPVPAFA